LEACTFSTSTRGCWLMEMRRAHTSEPTRATELSGRDVERVEHVTLQGFRTEPLAKSSSPEPSRRHGPAFGACQPRVRWLDAPHHEAEDAEREIDVREMLRINLIREEFATPGRYSAKFLKYPTIATGARTSS
jgi:hypothetical protein